MWVSVCGREHSDGGRLETCSCASLCRVACVGGSSLAGRVSGSVGAGSLYKKGSQGS